MKAYGCATQVSPSRVTALNVNKMLKKNTRPSRAKKQKPMKYKIHTLNKYPHGFFVISSAMTQAATKAKGATKPYMMYSRTVNFSFLMSSIIFFICYLLPRYFCAAAALISVYGSS